MSVKNIDLPPLPVTGEHFERAIPGDACHCTIGESVHDNLGVYLHALDLESAEGTSVQVRPADVEGNPCVNVSFIATRPDGKEVNVQFLLQDNTAFKIAHLTDRHASASMKRNATRRPYSLLPSNVRIRVRQDNNGTPRKDTTGSTKYDPRANIKSRASQAATASATVEDAKDLLLGRLERAELPYKVTPELKALALEQVEKSFASKGTRPDRKAPLRVYKNKRFYS